MKSLLLPMFLLVAAGACRSASTTVSLEPVADTFIRAQDPNRNFGGSEKLEIAGGTGSSNAAPNERVALFRFDISKIPATAVIASAHLSLTFDVPKNQIIDSKFLVCDLDREFQEAEATYRDAAKGKPWSAPGLARFTDYGSAYQFYCQEPLHVKDSGTAAADVTPFVRMAIDTHRSTASLVLVTTPNSPGGAVYSRRATESSNRPKLIVVFDPATPKAVTNHPFFEEKLGAITVDANASTKPDGSRTGLQYLWTVDRPAPASTYSPGQELGRAVTLKFEPDIPGQWILRLRVTDPATKLFSETVTTITNIKLAPHPRMGVNEEFLGQLKALRTANRPEWARFEEWLKKPGDPTYGRKAQALLFGYVTTKNKAYFQAAWKAYAPVLYTNGADRSKGLRPFFGACGVALVCEDHQASTDGTYATLEIALLYDWGFDALLPNQRQDIIDWLVASNDFDYLQNSFAHAHYRNDGIAVTTTLGASAYAIYGDTPAAQHLMTWFREEWDHTLQMMDVLATGGALGEGNAYQEANASALIDLCNYIFYASGENLFYSHPYFRRHLAYEAFSTYPNRLLEADSPIYHANPPRPIPEGAAVGGDDSRGLTWHSIHLRPNGLALVRRFPNTEEAEVWNWVFRQKDVDFPLDPWADVYYYSPPPALVKPKRLSFFDPGMGYVYVRSDWTSRDATWIGSWAGPHADVHQHLDQGSFEVFKRRDLAVKSGNYDDNPTKPHFFNYYTRTVSANNLLIGDPNEFVSLFIGYWGCDGAREHDLFPAPDNGKPVCIANDGGQRTMAPYSMFIAGNDEEVRHKDIYDTAKVTSFADNGQVVTWVADITNAYNNPRYTTPGNKPKVTKVYRKFAYFREPDLLFVADTVDSTNPDFQKSWLLHAVDHIEVGGAVKKIDDGESIHTGTDRARIVVDDKSPSNPGEVTSDLRAGYAALQLRTLFPTGFRYDLIGGREPDPAHRHLKDFWVKDYSEGIQPDHRSMNWPPNNPQEAVYPGQGPTFAGGYGRWRLEVQPTTPAKNDYFLNVLKPTLETVADMPEVTRFETSTNFGASFKSGTTTYKVTFSKETLDPPTVEGMDLTAPVISVAKPTSQLPANTRQAQVSVTTNEGASCRFSYRAGTTYPFMTGIFQSTDGLTHTTLNKELNAGDTYTYFVRCVDKSGNENLNDFKLTFSVAH